MTLVNSPDDKKSPTFIDEQGNLIITDDYGDHVLITPKGPGPHAYRMLTMCTTYGHRLEMLLTLTDVINILRYLAQP